MTIGIIGGGASGMAAALAAAKAGGRVILLERQARLGRKLQATGNGRCNLSNVYALQGGYHGDAPDFSRFALTSFPPSEIRSWFYDLGLYTVVEESGRVYPYSDQANSVVDVLRFSLEKLGVEVKTAFEVEKIRKENGVFRVLGNEQVLEFEKLIVACGGLAGSKLGGTNCGYRLLRSMGHSCTRLRPALVQIKTDWKGITALKGVRTNCKAEILKDDDIFAESSGELQFTEFGLSGPVIFEISRDVCQSRGDWQCRLDFLPEMSRQVLLEALEHKRTFPLPASELFTGILHNRLGRVITQAAGIAAASPLSELSQKELEMAADCAKAFLVHLTEPLGMDSAQVTAGGIVTREWNPETMESRLVPGLYACGEVLDIDGDCGGYNLQWAWSSGRLAGESAERA